MSKESAWQASTDSLRPQSAPQSLEQDVPSIRAADEHASASIYAPLDANRRQIRLVRVRQCTNKEIELELTAVSLDDEPKFNALSYLWTEAAADRVISVGGEPF